MNLIELNRALRQLRLGGMAAVTGDASASGPGESMAPLDLISCLVTDELTRRADRMLERRRKQAAVPRPAPDPRQLRFQLQQKDESQPGL